MRYSGSRLDGILDHVALCHNEHYVNELHRIAPSEGLVYIDGGTSMSPGDAGRPRFAASAARLPQPMRS